jgi:hypothetical protein
MKIPIENIIVPKGRRPLDQAKVVEIAASIKVVGLLSPIGVRGQLSLIDGSSNSVLVHGRHRLEACRSLGWKEIEAIKLNDVVPEGVQYDDSVAKMAEIAENLHRAELTTQQRNEHLAQWVALLQKRGTNLAARRQVPAKPGPKPSAAIAEVAKASGVGLKTVKEAVAASKVSPAVKAAADAAELSSKERLAVARLPEADQLEAVSKQAAINAKADRAAAKTPKPKPDVASTADRVEQAAAKQPAGQLTAAIEQLERTNVGAAITRMSNDERISLMTQIARATAWLNKTAIEVAISGGANLGKLAPPNLRYEALSFLHKAAARIEAELADRGVRESVPGAVTARVKSE